LKVSRVLGTRPYLPDEYLRDKKISTNVDTYRYAAKLRIELLNFRYSDILIVFSTFSVMESYCSSWALA
jgi:hypothetical protein